MRFLFLLLLLGSPIWPLGDTLPGDPVIIVNKRINELAWVRDGEIQLLTKVATGKTSDLTPEGIFTIIVKHRDPYYRRANIPGGHPKNPLGTRWMGFDARDTDGRIYGLHGTNQPAAIGKYVSNGCIRLSNSIVEKLYELVPIGTKVLIVDTKNSFEEIAREHGAMR